MAETLEDLKKKLTIWKDNIEAKGLLVNVNKTKFVCSKQNLSVKSDPVKWPYSICCTGVGSNSIFCQSCNTGFTVSQDDPEVIIGNDKFEVVDSLGYLRGSIGQSGSCFEATTGRVRVALKNFHSLHPLLINGGISLKVRGHAFNACIPSVLLYATEASAVKVDYIHQLVRSDSAMVRWICSTKLRRKIPMYDLKLVWIFQVLKMLYDTTVSVGLVISSVWMKKNGPEKSQILKSMVASLGAAQRKDGLKTLDVTLTNGNYQLLWQ